MTDIADIENLQGKSAKTLEKILVAAIACYGLFGIEETTLEQVADKAGVSRATVYRHARNRKELLTKVFIRDAQKAMSELQVVIRYQDSLEQIVIESVLFLVRRRYRYEMNAIMDEQLEKVTEGPGISPEILRLYAKKLLHKPYEKARANNQIPAGLTLLILTDWVGRMMRSLMVDPPDILTTEDALRDYLQVVLGPIFRT